MKKIIFILTLILSAVFTAYSQDDLIKAIQKSGVQIDSLQKALVSQREKNDSLNKNTGKQQKQIQKLEKELNGLKKFKEQKKATEQELQQKDKTIKSLETGIDSIKMQLKTERRNSEQTAIAKYREGQQSATANFLKSYQTKPFDELIKSSTKLSVQRDFELSVTGNDSVSKPVLSDLQEYFAAKELFEKKFDKKQTDAVMPALNSINRQSTLLEKLKENLDNYRDFTDGLKETIEKIRSIDEREKVAGMSTDIRNLKFHKILAEISLYIFNYDFNLVDYPYLSEIVLEIIKRKQPDADADISDLLNRINY
jgi:predicted RNase H-like nuclease (RuvC/YqgF family)